MNLSSETVAPEQIGAATPNVPGRKVLKALGWGVSLSLMFGFAIGIGLPSIVPALTDVDWLATIIASVVCLVVIFAHVVVFGGLSGLRHTLRLTPASWGQVGMALGLWLVVWVVALVVYAILAPVWDGAREGGLTVLRVGALYGRLHQADPALIVLGIIQAAILVPLLEELVLRGALFGWLRKSLSGRRTIAVTAAIFALYHPVFVWPLLLAFGLVAGWIRERTGSITPFLVAHVINSLAMIAASYFLVGWQVPL